MRNRFYLPCAHAKASSVIIGAGIGFIGSTSWRGNGAIGPSTKRRSRSESASPKSSCAIMPGGGFIGWKIRTASTPSIGDGLPPTVQGLQVTAGPISSSAGSSLSQNPGSGAKPTQVSLRNILGRLRSATRTAAPTSTWPASCGAGCARPSRPIPSLGRPGVCSAALSTRSALSLSPCGAQACPGVITAAGQEGGTSITSSPAANSIWLIRSNSASASTSPIFNRFGTLKICVKEAA